MKVKFSSIVASTVLAAGLASMSATAALADEELNLFADLAMGSNIGLSGNDDAGAIYNLFGQTVLNEGDLDTYKVEGTKGNNSYFTIEQTSEGVGTVSFDESLADYTFAFVLKAGNDGFDAYLLDGDAVMNQTFDWTTSNGKDLSHATVYLLDKDSPDPSQNVPEPATVLGLLAVGGMLVGKKMMDRKG